VRVPHAWQRWAVASHGYGPSAGGDGRGARPVFMLVDTSIWVDHFRRDNPALCTLLTRGEVECHPFIIGELACGQMQRRSEILGLLQRLPQVPLASHSEALEFVERHRLMGRGIGWIDSHLLASAALARTPLWSLDRRLSGIARTLGLDAQP